MTPSPSHPCQPCFLQEQRHGRVCPAAHDIYGLNNLAEQERRTAALRTGLTQDAQTLPSLSQLLTGDALRLSLSPGLLTPSVPLSLRTASSHPLLGAAPADRLFTTTRKESTNASAARSSE